MGDRATVTMFGKFSVTVEGSPVHIRTKPAQSLLANLCLDQGNTMPRTRLAANIWDDLDYGVSGNRLRTTLVILRQALSPWNPICADRHSIWIDTNSFATDFASATAILSKVRVIQDLDEELETHYQLLQIIDQPFLPGFDEPWANSIREIWQGHRSSALLRIAQIQEDLGFLTEALVAIERVFVRDDFHSQAWLKYLRLMAKANRANEALSLLESARKKMRLRLDREFDNDILIVANQVRHGSIRPSKNLLRFSPSEKNVLIATLETMATTAPDEFLNFLSSRSFNENIFQRPGTAFNLIVDSLNNASEAVDPVVRGTVARLGASAAFTLSYHKEREALCQLMIHDYPEESEFHAFGLAQLSFLKFEQRDMATAIELAKQAVHIAQRNAPHSRNRLLESSLAACHWHMLNFDEAEAIYASLLDALDSQDFVSQYNAALVYANWAFLKSIQLDWASCHHLCVEAKKRLTIHGFEAVGAAIGALFGCAKVMLGIHAGQQLIIDGLKDSYRQQNARVVEISLDYAACALIRLGRADRGLAVMDAATKLRDARQHVRSQAEQMLVDSIRAEANDAEANDSLLADVSLLDVVLYTCESLE